MWKGIELEKGKEFGGRVTSLGYSSIRRREGYELKYIHHPIAYTFQTAQPSTTTTLRATRHPGSISIQNSKVLTL
jgi:hypothetical protein